MSQYRKGYIAEKKVKDYMKKEHGCVCIESRGSHGVADLICGNGTDVYVIQVKSGESPPYVDWRALQSLAKMFKAVPLLIYCPKGERPIEVRNVDQLEGLRRILRDRKRENDKV